MKRILLFSMATLGFVLLSTSCGDKPVLPAQLPSEIQTFVTQYFPGQTITFAKKDSEWFGYKHEVILADGTELEFDTDNVWDMVDTKMNPVPATLVPATIATFVNTQFPAVAIVKIDKERYGYKVELASDLELKFNQQGTLLEMDD